MDRDDSIGVPKYVESPRKTSGKSPTTTITLVEYAGVSYQKIETDPDRVKLILNDAKHHRLKSFSKAVYESESRFYSKALVLMNSGIFEPGETPTGLHIENFKTMVPLNLKEGKGNFYTKPNGVFSIKKESPSISESSLFKDEKTIRLGVQSGPLLLSKGTISSKFTPKNPSRKRRNGVGVKGKKIIFLISMPGSKQPNMNELANAFKSLGCTDALYLDGTISKSVLSADLLRPKKGSNERTWERNYAGFFAIYP